ncbi:type III PLP-dependent enzyme [Shimia sp. NS0008-38b]
MRNEPALWPSPSWHLTKFSPDNPVLYFAPEVLQTTARRFIDGFEGLVTYAVKANDDEAVLTNLAGAGVSAFDVASPLEMQKVRRVSPNAILHYHNPVRSDAEIAEAVGHGIASWSIDCLRELEKLADVPRSGTEIAVRLRLPVAGAAYDFGEKFGADPEQAVMLLQQACAMGFEPSLTFHPGTQCEEPEAWAVYIREAADVAQRAGVTLRRLNVGGGFAAHRNGGVPNLEAVFARIWSETLRAFGDAPPALVCEPGRAMVAEAFTLAVRVKAVRNESIFLNDGIYGALMELRDIGVPDRISVIRKTGAPVGGAQCTKVVYGPTCDSLDRLPDVVALPEQIAEGDFVLIRAMGAYSSSLSTRFNGYGLQEMVTVAGL